MTMFQAIIYGIVQGVAEFLPISSSGHLAALPLVFGWKDPGLAFDVALHLGTLLSVVTYFFKDWINLLHAGVMQPKSRNGKLFWYLVIATIPGAIIGKLLEEKAETIFRNLALIGTMLIVMGIILYISDKISKKQVNLKDIGLKRSFTIGLSQALAIIPGVSRSGITMSAGLLTGLTRESVAKFSFLLSTPIIFGAGIVKIKDLINTPRGDLPLLFLGVASAAIAGFISVKFMMNYLKTKGFGIFAIYRVILGLTLIALYFFA